MTNTEILCFVLGWQGGTVHQVAATLGVAVDDVIIATPEKMRELCRLAQRWARDNATIWKTQNDPRPR